jgi:pimeloyl-ACP methyl ester carboxylesterase
MAKHVIAFADALGLTQIDLLGFSLGGFVAQEVALQSPHLIRSIILAGTGPQGGEGMDSFKPKIAKHATQETLSLRIFSISSSRRARHARLPDGLSGTVVTVVLTRMSRLRWRLWRRRQMLLPAEAWFPKRTAMAN